MDHKFFIKKKIKDKPKIVKIKYPDQMNLLKIMPNTFIHLNVSKKKSLIINLIDEVVK